MEQFNIELDHSSDSIEDALNLDPKYIGDMIDFLNTNLTEKMEGGRKGLKPSEVIEIIIKFITSDSAKPPYPLVRVMLFLMQMGLEKIRDDQHGVMAIDVSQFGDGAKDAIKEIVGKLKEKLDENNK